MSTSDSGNDLRSDQYEVGEKRNEFKPVTYNFRVPEKKKSGLGVLSPPEWLLLDHTIAVVWSLFSNSSPGNLDIDDLKWAHEYLKEVRNNKGENPPDVRTCLKEIQNRLISLYAQLTHEDNKKQEPTVEINTEPMILKVKESIKEVDNSAQKQSTSPKEQGKTHHAQSRRESLASFKHTAKNAKKAEPPRKATQKKEEVILTEVFHRSICGDFNSPVMKKSKKSRQNENDTFSQDTLESVGPTEGGKLSLQFKKWITEEDLNNEEQAYRKLKNEIRNLLKNPKISKDEVLKFLSNWREEQVLRLESELKRLNSIEQFMRSLKVEGFVPYLQDEPPHNMEMIKKIKKIT